MRNAYFGLALTALEAVAFAESQFRARYATSEAPSVRSMILSASHPPKAVQCAHDAYSLNCRLWSAAAATVQDGELGVVDRGASGDQVASDGQLSSQVGGRLGRS
jgi:hypothetical protein